MDRAVGKPHVLSNVRKLILKNSLKIHEENTKKITAVSVVLYVINFMLIYINFSFDFLGLDNLNSTLTTLKLVVRKNEFYSYAQEIVGKFYSMPKTQANRTKSDTVRMLHDYNTFIKNASK